jgi:ubiquinone/menaquinone biosynthesis C-methylase UbiE
MERARRLRLIVWTSLVLLTTVIIGVTIAAGPPAWLSGDQWRLDIEQALNAVGVVPGMVVGEAGAGDGYFTLPLARRVGPRGAVVANDISRRALASLETRARDEGLNNVQTVAGDVDDPRFPRRDLEVVVVVHAFHDFDKPVEWLVNLKKYLRPGARVAIIDRDPARGAESHFWPRDRIRGYAKDAGYDLVTSADADTDHLIMVFTPRSA